MHLSYLIYLAVLFFLLVPGVLVTLPKGGSKMVVAATHAFVFIVVYVLTKKFFKMLAHKLEGFKEGGKGKITESGTKSSGTKSSGNKATRGGKK